jgi:hypothetical protein
MAHVRSLLMSTTTPSRPAFIRMRSPTRNTMNDFYQNARTFSTSPILF